MFTEPECTVCHMRALYLKELSTLYEKMTENSAVFFFISTVLNFVSTVLYFASTLFFFVSTVLNFVSTVLNFVSKT